jgi:NADH:ubiquinone oxidoreductase subunit 6 (subunit J)
MFSPKALGYLLYTNYLVAFELVGVLLLAAIIGAIVMAKKKLVD